MRLIQQSHSTSKRGGSPLDCNIESKSVATKALSATKACDDGPIFLMNLVSGSLETDGSMHVLLGNVGRQGEPRIVGDGSNPISHALLCVYRLWTTKSAPYPRRRFYAYVREKSFLLSEARMFSASKGIFGRVVETHLLCIEGSSREIQ